jgi:hypothetical protein
MCRPPRLVQSYFKVPPDGTWNVPITLQATECAWQAIEFAWHFQAKLQNLPGTFKPSYGSAWHLEATGHRETLANAIPVFLA